MAGYLFRRWRKRAGQSNGGVSVQGHGNITAGRDVTITMSQDPEALVHRLADEIERRMGQQQEQRKVTERQIRVHWLARAINMLPEREKIVITLYYYEQLSIAEIADVLGVDSETIDKMHVDALRLMSSRIMEMVFRPGDDPA